MASSVGTLSTNGVFPQNYVFAGGRIKITRPDKYFDALRPAESWYTGSLDRFQMFERRSKRVIVYITTLEEGGLLAVSLFGDQFTRKLLQLSHTLI
jgi:hypothetical protein